MERTVDISEILYCREGRYSKDFREAGYFLKSYEIIYLKSGTLKITLNEKVYLLREKNMFLAVPGSFITVGNDNSEAVIINCSFKGLIRYENLKESGIFDISALKEKYITNTVYLFSRREEKACQLARLNIEILLTVLSDNISSLKLWEFESLTSQSYRRIFNYLSSNTDKMLELSEIARANNLTVASLKATVNKYAGVGVLKLFNIIKIMKSMEYARYETDAGVIANSLGFTDAAYFRKMFYNTSGIRIKDYINGVNNERNLRKIRCVSSGI